MFRVVSMKNLLQTIGSTGCVKTLKIPKDIGDTGLTEQTKLCKRFWPSKTNTQGFFMALFQKE
jgi:16S rRNA C967 or C1407 C5-methylase (RsmB/RsmF family)